MRSVQQRLPTITIQNKRRVFSCVISFSPPPRPRWSCRSFRRLRWQSGYHGKVWRDSHGRYRCKRPNGTTGLIVGAAGGALVGRAIDTRGERATGTILGAAAGALLGRSIDRSRVRCR